MKRAKSPEILSGFLNLNIRTDDLDDIEPVFYFFDRRVFIHNFYIISGNEARKEALASLSGEEIIKTYYFKFLLTIFIWLLGTE